MLFDNDIFIINPGAWLLTSGTESQGAGLVGESVQNYISTSANQNQASDHRACVAINISAWGAVANNHDLDAQQLPLSASQPVSQSEIISYFGSVFSRDKTLSMQTALFASQNENGYHFNPQLIFF